MSKNNTNFNREEMYAVTKMLVLQLLIFYFRKFIYFILIFKKFLLENVLSRLYMFSRLCYILSIHITIIALLPSCLKYLFSCKN